MSEAQTPPDPTSDPRGAGEPGGDPVPGVETGESPRPATAGEEPTTHALSAPPEGWAPYSATLGARCNACGDLLSSPAGCPACRPELMHFQSAMNERVRQRARGFAPNEFLRGASYLFRGGWCTRPSGRARFPSQLASE